jgi:hypothetical protein
LLRLLIAQHTNDDEWIQQQAESCSAERWSVDECLDAVVAIALGCWTFGLSGEE